MKKIIVLDIDGTLISKREYVSNKLVVFLKKIHEEGAIIVLATGRSLVGIPKFFFDFDFVDYFITSNGSSIYEKKNYNIIYKNRMNFNDVLIVCNYFKNKNVIIDSLIDGTWHIDGSKITNLSKIIKSKKTVNYIHKTRVIEKDFCKYLSLNKNSVEKITINFNPLEKEFLFDEFLSRNLLPNCEIWSDKKHKFDIYNKNTNKWSAVNYLLQLLNISSNDLISFGNDYNDIDLIKNSGIGVCMKNSDLNLKRISQNITTKNFSSGVYFFLKDFFKKENV